MPAMLNTNYKVVVSELKYIVKCINKHSLISIEFLITNQNDFCTFFYQHKPICLSTIYKNQNKIAMFKKFDKKILTKFDDEVASDNFAICFYQQDEIASYIECSNFRKGKLTINLANSDYATAVF